MELGEKIKNARLAAGLSQRQLCGDIITRNMLSQIEKGTAKPSFATLQALCAKLSMPVSFFIDDVPSDNLSILYQAFCVPAEQALALLESYSKPDPMLDPFHQGFLCHTLLTLAETALENKRSKEAEAYTRQAAVLLHSSPDLQAHFGKRLTLLQFELRSAPSQDLAACLPDNTQEQLLRATAAFQKGDSAACLAHLACADRHTAMGQLLEGRALLHTGAFDQAANCLSPLETEMPQIVYPLLEECYREMGDFQKAYYYACKQR